MPKMMSAQFLQIRKAKIKLIKFLLMFKINKNAKDLLV